MPSEQLVRRVQALLQLVAIQTRSNGTLLLGCLLLGLHLVCDQPAPGFASQSVPYPLRLRSRVARQRLRLQLKGGESLVLESLEVGETSINLSWCPQRCGL